MKINYYKRDRSRSQFTVSADLARLYALICCAGNSEAMRAKIADIAQNATAKITLRRAVEAEMINEIENEYFLKKMAGNAQDCGHEYTIFNPEKNAYWLPQGKGYTKDKTKAGSFAGSSLSKFNLDGQQLKKVN